MTCKEVSRLIQKKIGTSKLDSMSDIEKEQALIEILSSSRLLFGVNSNIPSNIILQNNLTMFEWVKRNKLYPNFWGRNLTGDNALTEEEIKFLRAKGCKIAAICKDDSAKNTDEEGKKFAKKIVNIAKELGVKQKNAFFLEIEEKSKTNRKYLRGYAKELLSKGYIPGFKANTDAAFDFDRQFCIGMKYDKSIFELCLVWAVAPSIKEYDGISTSHMVHPDQWKPFAPSAITRNDISIWQYGKNCHPIYDDNNNKTTFNIDLVKNDRIIINYMF